jgi:hypothetical protein
MDPVPSKLGSQPTDLKCLSFIISRLNLTWLNELCLFLLTAVS